MKYKIIVDRSLDEIVIHTPEKNGLVDKIEELIRLEECELLGFSGSAAVKLDASAVSCFFVEDGRVFARCDGKKYAMKERLYQLEERFSSGFVKINQSCIVSVDKIERFDTSIGGSLMVTLKDGYRDYVSRRQLKAVKERIGF